MRLLALPALLCLLIAAPLLSAAATLDGVGLGTTVHGPKVTADDLKGRVVLFEYWGVNCPPCLASIPKLAEWQQHYDRDTFVIVANHCQGGSADQTRSVWLAKGGGDQISVIDNGDLKGAQVSGIPHCFLFDHNGTLLYEGSPFRVEEALKKAIEASPGALVAGYEWKALSREAQAIGKRQGVAGALRSVRKQALSEDTAIRGEAEELLGRVDGWVAKQQAEMTAARSEDPVEAVRIASTMAGVFKGDELAGPFETALKELRADKSVQQEVRAAEMLTRVKVAAASYGLSTDPKGFQERASNKGKAQEIAGGLKMVITRFADTKAATEAEALAKTWLLTN